jgi:hypothetical protein
MLLDASSFSILPTFSPTSSITQSIQLKGDTANWKKVPQNVARIHSPHPRYLRMMEMATLRKIIMTNLRASPHHQKGDEEYDRPNDLVQWDKTHSYDIDHQTLGPQG